MYSLKFVRWLAKFKLSLLRLNCCGCFFILLEEAVVESAQTRESITAHRNHLCTEKASRRRESINAQRKHHGADKASLRITVYLFSNLIRRIIVGRMSARWLILEHSTSHPLAILLLEFVLSPTWLATWIFKPETRQKLLGEKLQMICFAELHP